MMLGTGDSSPQVPYRYLCIVEDPKRKQMMLRKPGKLARIFDPNDSMLSSQSSVEQALKSDVDMDPTIQSKHPKSSTDSLRDGRRLLGSVSSLWSLFCPLRGMCYHHLCSLSHSIHHIALFIIRHLPKRTLTAHTSTTVSVFVSLCQRLTGRFFKSQLP